MSLFLYDLASTLVLNWSGIFKLFFKESAINTSFLCPVVALFGLYIYFSYQRKERQLRLLEEDRAEAANTYGFLFYDEKHELRLSVKRTNLLYIESADNYVQPGISRKGVLTKFMLRNFETIERDRLKRTKPCRHRSYMAYLTSA